MKRSKFTDTQIMDALHWLYSKRPWSLSKGIASLKIDWY